MRRPQKWPFKSFQSPHINQIRCVLKNKNVVMKLYYIILILRLILYTLLMFLFFHIAWIIASVRLGCETYKSFTIFTGTKYHPLWLGPHIKMACFLLMNFHHSFWQHVIYDLCWGSNLVNLSIQWHSHKSVSVVLHANCDMKLRNAKNYRLLLTLISNITSIFN